MRLQPLAPAAALIAFAGPAFAEDRAWSAEATLASEYISKGAGRSDGAPHLGVKLERRLNQDVYAGAWTGTLRSPLGAEGETHLYVGWRPQAAGWRFDLRPMFKVLAGAQSGQQSEQWEVRLDAAHQVAGARLRLRAEYAPDGYGAATESTWLEADISRKLGDSGWTLSGGLGRREQAVGRDYTAWNLGVQRRLAGPFSLDVRWLDTDQTNAGRDYDGRVVASLNAAWR